MEGDSMDWCPTTPPAVYDPYHIPQYMPGGWPAPTPPLTHTTGVFARKRKSNPLIRVVKRVCLGLRTAGAIATKPAYLVVREFRARRRERSRRRSSATQSQQPGVSSAQENSHPAVLVAPQPAPEGSLLVLTPPSTPPCAATVCTFLRDTGFDAAFNELPVVRDPDTDTETLSSEQTSDIDTDTQSDDSDIDRTTITKTPREGFDVPKSHVVSSPCVTAARAGIKRRRSQDFDPEHFFIAIHDQLISDDPEKILYTHSSMADAQRPAKRSKRGYNPFDAASPWGSVWKLPMKPARARVEPPDDNKNLFTPWAVAKPINVAPLSPAPSRSPSPSLQLRDELTTYASTRRDEDKSSDETDVTQPPAPHDRTWSSVSILNRFRKATETLNSEEPSKLGSTDHQDASFLGREVEGRRLFHAQEPVATPPPVRNRAFSGTHLAYSRSDETSQTPTSHETEIKQPRPSGPINATEDTATIKVESVPPTISTCSHDEKDTQVIKEDHGDEYADTADLNSMTTPAKTTTQPSQPTPVANTVAIGLETPSGKLAKLTIHDGDNDTPKAIRHSGTKTVRVTRYREAQEKALKSKLEEYELVPITEEWDKKVRDAVRTGIPHANLKPHDIARVAPQYARRGQDNWLNDETVNAYLDVVAAHGRKNDRPDQVKTHHAFKSFFYEKIQSAGPQSIITWSRRAKIGGKSLAKVEKVFVPINSGVHWTLAVVEPTQKKITHYNSMSGTQTGIQACRHLKAWVALELGKDFNDEEWSTEAVGTSPQQTNSDDCGVFTITSARQIMLGLTPMSYSSSQIPLQRLRIVAELINKGLLKSTEQQ